MTPESARSLVPSTPVFVTEFSSEDGEPEWSVKPAYFHHAFDRPGSGELHVSLRDFTGKLEGRDVGSAWSVPAAEVHLTRLDALQWVGEQLAEYRRMGDEAADRLTGEIVAARRDDGREDGRED